MARRTSLPSACWPRRYRSSCPRRPEPITGARPYAHVGVVGDLATIGFQRRGHEQSSLNMTRRIERDSGRYGEPARIRWPTGIHPGRPTWPAPASGRSLPETSAASMRRSATATLVGGIPQQPQYRKRAPGPRRRRSVPAGRRTPANTPCRRPCPYASTDGRESDGTHRHSDHVLPQATASWQCSTAAIGGPVIRRRLDVAPTMARQWTPMLVLLVCSA